MSASPKIVLLAIDAGDKELIRQWAADGTLPSIGRLLSRGLAGDIAGVEGLYEGATWPSFYTGVNPARHGLHRLVQIEPGTYEFRRRYPRESIKREPFWERLGRAGRRVAVLDIPLSGISEGLNGIQTVEWGSHDAAYGFLAWPPELEQELWDRFGGHPADTSCDSLGRSTGGFRRFTARLIEGVRQKTELTLHCLAKEDWDFFAQVFTEGHCAGHQCWHLHDRSHPDYDPAVAARTGDPVREVYRAIDEAIGRIIDHVSDDTLVVLVASHRMAHNVGADFLLEEILEKLGVLRRRPAATAGGRQTPAVAVIDLARALWRRLPGPVQTALKPALDPLYAAIRDRALQTGAPQLSPTIDLSRSLCFPHPNGGLVSGIRVNLSGREPAGVVEAGAGFDDFCGRVSADLLDIVDQRSGRPIVKRVMRTADLFQGDYLAHLPDLLVEWNDEVRIGSKAVRDDPSCRVELTSHKIGVVEGEYAYCRTGDHRPEGLFLAAGAGVEPQTLSRAVSIMDFAPTILGWFGLPGDDLDGEAIPEIVRVARPLPGA